MDRYETVEDYIYGEYATAVEDAMEILDRVIGAGVTSMLRDQAALEIAGYFSGCLRVDGSPGKEIATIVASSQRDRREVIAERMEQLKGSRPW